MIKPTFKQYHYKLQYYNDEIEVLKEYINNIKTYKSPQNKPVYNIEMHLHLHLLNSFVKHMVFHIMHLILIELVS